MMTAKAPATRQLLLRATISVRASQLGGDSGTEGGSCQLSTPVSQGRVGFSKWLQQRLWTMLKHWEVFRWCWNLGVYMVLVAVMHKATVKENVNFANMAFLIEVLVICACNLEQGWTKGLLQIQSCYVKFKAGNFQGWKMHLNTGKTVISVFLFFL